MASNLKVDIVKPTATNGSLSLKGDSGGSATSNGISIDSSGNTSVSGQLNADNIRLDGNTISSTDTDGDINLTPNGTGSVVISKGEINSKVTLGQKTKVTGGSAPPSDLIERARYSILNSASLNKNWVSSSSYAGIEWNLIYCNDNTSYLEYEILIYKPVSFSYNVTYENNLDSNTRTVSAGYELFDGDGFTTTSDSYGSSLVTLTDSVSFDSSQEFVHVKFRTKHDSTTGGGYGGTTLGITKLWFDIECHSAEFINTSFPIQNIDINGGAIDGTTIGGTTPAVGSFTQVNADNIRLDGNTISSTDTDGDINLAPDGTGSVIVDDSLQTDSITDLAGTGAPDFPNGLTGLVFSKTSTSGLYTHSGSGSAANVYEEIDSSFNFSISLPAGTTVLVMGSAGEFFSTSGRGFFKYEISDGATTTIVENVTYTTNQTMTVSVQIKHTVGGTGTKTVTGKAYYKSAKAAASVYFDNRSGVAGPFCVSLLKYTESL